MKLKPIIASLVTAVLCLVLYYLSGLPFERGIDAFFGFTVSICLVLMAAVYPYNET